MPFLWCWGEGAGPIVAGRGSAPGHPWRMFSPVSFGPPLATGEGGIHLPLAGVSGLCPQSSGCQGVSALTLCGAPARGGGELAPEAGPPATDGAGLRPRPSDDIRQYFRTRVDTQFLRRIREQMLWVLGPLLQPFSSVAVACVQP